MDEEMFKEWLDNPVTEVFFKYLGDLVKQESALAGSIIAGGGVIERDEQVRISESCATLTSIRDIEYSEIESFYSEEKD
jgi:hypothetical protein